MLMLSLASPVLTWACLPFLRGEVSKRYGVLSCGWARLRGVCGGGRGGAMDAVELIRGERPSGEELLLDNVEIANDPACNSGPVLAYAV